MDVDIGKRLEEKARYIVQIQVFKDFPETFLEWQSILIPFLILYLRAKCLEQK